MKEINWVVSKEDAILINQIVHFLQLNMDITATHLNGCSLKLVELLKTDDGNFAHDVFGIRRHIDRETGQLKHCFLPRYAV